MILHERDGSMILHGRKAKRVAYHRETSKMSHCIEGIGHRINGPPPPAQDVNGELYTDEYFGDICHDCYLSYAALARKDW